jgi:putative ABC transport system permease protein
VNKTLAVVREALASARAQPVASAVSIVIVAGMVASVLLTTGRTVGSEQDVLSSIDSAGTRSIVVRAEGDAGLDTSVLERLAHIQGVYWIGAFGAATDVTNVDIDGGRKVPARSLWTDQPSMLGVPETSVVPDRSAWASRQALRELGITEGAGGIVGDSGDDVAIVGEFTTPDYLAFLEPVIVIPHQRADPEPVAVLVVIADRPDLVAPLTRIVGSVLDVDDPTKVSISTSERLATLRALIEGQLGTFGRTLVLLIFGVSGLLVATILYALVMFRRKDFGRRRALGASQGLIISLLLLQMTALSLLGALVGTAVATTILVSARDPLPDAEFVIAIDLLAVTVAVAAALLPALTAARREPITELRVP